MKNLQFGSIVILLLIANMLCLPAQSNWRGKNKRFEHFSNKEGLTQSAINCIIQDSRGFMWFGTQDGLNRYDGYSFTPYRNEPGNPHRLEKNWINAIYESPRYPGILWIGTTTGLCTYDFKTDSITVCENILGTTPIKAILEDLAGNLWFASGENGLIQLDPKKNIQSLKNFNATVLMKDGDGNIWIGSNKGELNKLDWKNHNITTYQVSRTGLTDNRVLSLLCDRDGDIWIGTDGGGLICLHKNKNNKEIFTTFPASPDTPGGLNNGHVKSIFQDSSGLFWIGTNGGGLSCFQKGTKQFISFTKNPNNPYSISHNDIEVIFEDKAGSLWIGTQGEGINKIDSRYDNFVHYQYQPYDSNGLKHEKIWSIIEGKNGLFWIGTDGGLYRFDIQKDSFQHITHNIDRPNSLIHNQILSICEDNSGNLWLGSDGGGLYKYNPANHSSLHYFHDPNNPASLTHNRISSIIQDSTGLLWFGTDEGGISCLNPNKTENKNGKNLFFTSYIHQDTDPSSLSHNNAFIIYEDRDKTIWVGTRGGGLNRFDPVGKNFQHFKHDPAVKNCLSDNSVLTIVMDSSGSLWVGTENGLNKFDVTNGVWTQYTMKDGLPNNVINGILEENPLPGQKPGKIWISTNLGLSRFDVLTGKFKNYDIHDGLQSNEFNTNAYTKSKNGIIFFGGIKGFNVFDPCQFKYNNYIPPVFITDFEIANKPKQNGQKDNLPISLNIAETKEIWLTYLESSFSFSFAVLNYIQPEKNQYKYMLKGYNEDWVLPENKQKAVYTKVQPGRYEFKVIGANNDGVWNEKGASVIIHIAPPFWLSWWFIVLMAVSLMGILFLLHKRRTTHIREKMEKERLEKELQLKADFTAMLVHDLKSPLTAIVGYAQMMESMPNLVDMNKTGQVISRSCDNMLRLINDMLDLSKFEAGKMVLNKSNTSLFGIIKENLEVMMPLIKNKEITLVWEPDENVKGTTLFIDPEKIDQVLNNLLSNAIKYAPDNGSGNIKITLSKEMNQYMELSVSNNGPIVPEADRDSLFDMYAQLNLKSRVKGTGVGLAVSKIIIESHGGTINYRPGENGIGSTFYFRLPISQE